MVAQRERGLRGSEAIDNNFFCSVIFHLSVGHHIKEVKSVGKGQCKLLLGDIGGTMPPQSGGAVEGSANQLAHTLSYFLGQPQ